MAENRDQASLLLWSLSGWYQQNQTQRNTSSRKKRLRSLRKTQDDEKSLCASDWSGDLSLDHPSYGSIFLQIQEANTEADGSLDFVWKTLDIFGKTLVVTFILGVLMVLPISMISIGVKYLHECPIEPKIPIYLLVGGSFGLIKLLSMLWKQVRSRHYERLDDIYDPDADTGDVVMSRSSKFSEIVMSLFLFIWFVCGNYWVFHVWQPHFIALLHEPSNWCDKTVYMFAFCQILGCYGLMALISFLIFTLTLCHRYTTVFDKS